MDSIMFFYIFIWMLGGWITGLVLKNTGLAIKGGHIFLMFIGWGIAGIFGILGVATITGGGFMEELFDFGLYGLIVGIVGGLVTVRQIAKARKKKQN